MERDPYPQSPGWRSGPAEATSRAGALAITGRAKTIRQRILDLIKSTPSGLTSDEIGGQLGISEIQVRPRVAELHGQHEIEQSGQHRRNRTGMRATVWRAAPPLPNEGAR